MAGIQSAKAALTSRIGLIEAGKSLETDATSLKDLQAGINKGRFAKDDIHTALVNFMDDKPKFSNPINTFLGNLNLSENTNLVGPSTSSDTRAEFQIAHLHISSVVKAEAKATVANAVSKLGSLQVSRHMSRPEEVPVPPPRGASPPPRGASPPPDLTLLRQLKPGAIVNRGDKPT